MIRFINLGTQLYLTNDTDGFEFAFYCTVRDVFEEFSGSQTWASKKEFIADYDGDELDRYLSLIPEGWNIPDCKTGIFKFECFDFQKKDQTKKISDNTRALVCQEDEMLNIAVWINNNWWLEADITHGRNDPPITDSVVGFTVLY